MAVAAMPEVTSPHEFYVACKRRAVLNFGNRGDQHISPEAYLIIAIIQQAVLDTFNSADKIREDANSWLLSGDDTLGSFRWCVDLLDASYTADQILGFIKKNGV